jgi:hypothetical protein
VTQQQPAARIARAPVDPALGIRHQNQRMILLVAAEYHGDSLIVPEASADGLRQLAREFRAWHRLRMSAGGFGGGSGITQLAAGRTGQLAEARSRASAACALSLAG